MFFVIERQRDWVEKNNILLPTNQNFILGESNTTAQFSLLMYH